MRDFRLVIKGTDEDGEAGEAHVVVRATDSAVARGGALLEMDAFGWKAGEFDCVEEFDLGAIEPQSYRDMYCTLRDIAQVRGRAALFLSVVDS